jgi:hypothetical protein
MSGLFEHALRLHRLHPDGPLPGDGEPYPDEDYEYRAGDRDRRRHGADVAAVLDRHFGTAAAPPSDLADAFRDLHVPFHRNDHIAAAALRADADRVRHTGRWLVKHGTGRHAVAVGLALLATDFDAGDIPLIRTIGLLSDHFSPLAAEALRHRRDGDRALLWLARRVANWGRVYIVQALCDVGGEDSRRWLLRHACDGGYLSGYFAGRVATAAHLHAAIVDPGADDDLVDHTGRLMRIMTGCHGMGMTIDDYPPAPLVLAAHVAHLARQAPTVDRYVDAATIADHLAGTGGGLTRDYLAILEQPAWCDRVRADFDRNTAFYGWFAGTIATRLRLAAFTDA